MPTEFKKANRKVISIQREQERSSAESRREAFISDQMVNILKDLLQGMRLPKPQKS